MSFFKSLFGKSSSKPAPAPTAAPEKSTPAPSPELLKYSRPAWLWTIAHGESAVDATRIGGRSLMGEAEQWPNCGDCKNPLTFMIQCNLDTLPDGMKDHDSGILRFFYCMHEDCVGMGGWEAFDPQHHLSILQGYGHTKAAPSGTVVIPPTYLSQTNQIDDVPHWEDRTDTAVQDEPANAHYGHKFAGWLCWIQGPERPNCPDCKTVMEPFIQLDEDATRDFNFGGGIGHISQCPNHPDSLAFGWACG